MNTIQKKKLCWNCEGRVPLEEENCSYCGVYLGPAPDEEGGQDILDPPYRIVETEEEEAIPQSPYEMVTSKEEEGENTELAQTKSDFRYVVFPLLFLSLGSMSLFFGLILLLFSKNGVFSLTWNGDLWYLYLVFAAPILFLGWKTLKNLEDENELQKEPASKTNIDF